MNMKRAGLPIPNGADRDAIIDLYMSGRMAPAHEQMFLRMLEDDPALRHAFETERAISGALLRDRAALPSVGSESRTRLLAALATVPIPDGLPSTGTGAGSGLSIAAAVKGAVAVIAVTGAVVVGVMTIPADRPTSVPDPPFRQERSLYVDPMVPPVPEGPSSPIETERPARPEKKEAVRIDAEPTVGPPLDDAGETTIGVESQADAPEMPSSSEPEVRTTDSVNASVTIDLRGIVRTSP